MLVFEAVGPNMIAMILRQNAIGHERRQGQITELGDPGSAHDLPREIAPFVVEPVANADDVELGGTVFDEAAGEDPLHLIDVARIVVCEARERKHVRVPFQGNSAMTVQTPAGRPRFALSAHGAARLSDLRPRLLCSDRRLPCAAANPL